MKRGSRRSNAQANGRHKQAPRLRSTPNAGPVTITRSDGTTETQPAYTAKELARIDPHFRRPKPRKRKREQAKTEGGNLGQAFAALVDKVDRRVPPS